MPVALENAASRMLGFVGVRIAIDTFLSPDRRPTSGLGTPETMNRAGELRRA